MSKGVKNPGRRRFVKTGAGCVAAIPVVGLFSGVTIAEDLPLIDESDPTAQNVGYKHEGKNVDKEKFPQYTEDQTCSTCHLYQAEADAPQGPCPIFPGKAVKAAGWCSAWVPKA